MSVSTAGSVPGIGTAQRGPALDVDFTNSDAVPGPTTTGVQLRVRSTDTGFDLHATGPDIGDRHAQIEAGSPLGTHLAKLIPQANAELADAGVRYGDESNDTMLAALSRAEPGTLMATTLTADGRRMTGLLGPYADPKGASSFLDATRAALRELRVPL